MRCDDCQLVIEEYFDGELNEQTALSVRRHLDGCQRCSQVLQGLTAEQSFYVSSRSEIQMSPDLWSSVRTRLALEQQAERSSFPERLQMWLSSIFILRRISGLTAVALVILAVGLTMLLMRYFDRSLGDLPLTSVSESDKKVAPPMLEQRPAAAEPSSSVEGRPNAVASDTVESTVGRKRPASRRMETVGKMKTPEQLVREAEVKYLTAIAMLSRTVERKRARLDAATLAKLEQALASIDRTIADTRKAVRQHPDDPVAVQYMLTAYAKKVDVLREMVDY